MSERDPDKPLDGTDLAAMEARLQRMEAAQRAKTGSGKKATGTTLGIAFRISAELVAAIGVGTGLGWALDEVAGTRPWGMLVFFLLGCAAAMKNMMRAIAEMDAQQRDASGSKTDRS